MRIRLRVPQDGESKPTGLFGWLGSLFSREEPAAPAAVPQSAPDKRWTKHAKARYFPAGRLCIPVDGSWESAYLFDVQAGGETQQIRVILAERDVEGWQKMHDKRMPEALRLRLVRETLHAFLDLERYPSSGHVNPLEIENAQL